MSTDTSLENFAEVPPEDACVNYRQCGNTTLGANNSMCIGCLDEARKADSEY